MDQPTSQRTYFTVTDEGGHPHPAVEYLAATLDADAVVQDMPTRRFIRLIGAGEHLQAIGRDGVGSSDARAV